MSFPVTTALPIVPQIGYVWRTPSMSTVAARGPPWLLPADAATCAAATHVAIDVTAFPMMMEFPRMIF